MVLIRDVCFFPRNDTATGVDVKQKAFQREWDSRLVNASADICAEVARYIHEVHLKLNHGTLGTPVGQIHTALLLGTVNTPDHMAFFSNLKGYLRKCGRVAIIDCSAEALTADQIFSSIDQQCNSSVLNFASHESMGLSAAKSVTGLSGATSVCKSKSVGKWKAKVRKSCRRTRPSNSIMKLSVVKCHSVPLVVVIPAIESVPSNVLREFVRITSVRVKERRGPPIFFVFGITSTEDLVLESHCDAATLSCLTVKRFHMRRSSVFLDAVFTEIFYVPGFRASPPIIRCLIDKMHNCLDYSIKNLLDRYKVAVLKHYLTLPHPQLLAPLEEAEKFLSSISDAELPRFVSTYPSLLSFSVNMEVDQSTHFVVTRQLLQESLLRHWLVQLILPFVIKWVLALFGDFHKHPMTDNTAGLYCDWIAGRLISEDIVRRFRALPPTRVLSSIETSVGSITASLSVLQMGARQRRASPPLDKTMRGERSALRGVSGGEFPLNDPRWLPCLPRAICVLTELRNAVCKWQGRLAAALETQMAAKAADSQCSSTKAECATLELSRRLTLLGLREKLLRSRSSSAASSTSSLWKQTMEELEQWLFAVLSPDSDNSLSLVPAPHNLPFHEVFYGPSSQEAELVDFERNVDPPLIGAVHHVLCNPDDFLPAVNVPQPPVPDVCIVYKIYMESGSLINIHDWLISFATIVEPSSASADGNPSQLIQSRFLRAVADLEQVGLVRRTGRRVDHAQKLPLMELNSTL
ncbi:origin recognition complex subunit 3 [Echinococcus multilocularis]|uniref:Origin recognition complex subunit 3 n=1 Tax=Echinococcus multilocularis TaxID=6211 RepID=A0A087VWV0_ECHMU|nr:origin recognition complex subunit 3 [Echinococcus multilocularis]